MFSEDSPIYQQLAAQIADDIVKGTYVEEAAVPSSNEFAAFLQLNPATAGKALNVLVEQGVLYKKRGVGMFVSSGARGHLLEQRRTDFPKHYIQPLIREAQLADIGLAELTDMIRKEYQA